VNSWNLVCECDFNYSQVKGQKPPAPVRGLSGADAAEADEEAEEDDDGGAATDLVPRNDIR